MFASPRLAAVADGVGGAAAGEVASRALINALVHVDKCRLQGCVEDALVEGIARGNETIGFIAACRPAMAGMSTTVTAVALGDEGCVVANVGDSRTYLLRDGALTQLTRDDSWVQLMLDAGELTPDEARDHPRRSLVLAALDGEPDHDPDPDEVRRPARRPAAAVLGWPVRRGRRRDDRGDAAHPRARRLRGAPDRARAGRRRARQHLGRRRRRRPATRCEGRLVAAPRRPGRRRARSRLRAGRCP